MNDALRRFWKRETRLRYLRRACVTTWTWLPEVGGHVDREGRLCVVGVTWLGRGVMVLLRGTCHC